MLDLLTWVATLATIGGALLTASNLGARITGTGFVIFLFGSLAWLALAAMTGQQALLWTNIVLTLLNLFGIWRWLGRQAKVEEGGQAAAEASDARPGEALFPVSLLAKAEVVADGQEVGSCVDAMAGCDSGRLAYVIVSEGGVAGIGEHLRRLDWRHSRIQDGRLVASLGRRRFCDLPIVARDAWPAR